MEIEGEHRFNASRAAVWELLLDPAALKAAIPGCERFEPAGTDAYDATLKVGIAAIRGTYTGRITVSEKKPGDSYRLGFEGGGTPGRVQGSAVMTLTEDAAGVTMVRYAGDVKAQGALARLGSRLLGGAAKLMVGQFFKGMERQVADRTP